MNLGVEYRENYQGSFFFLDQPEKEFALSAQFLVHARAARSLVRERYVDLSGALTAEGLCSDAAVTGSVGFKVGTRRIPYEFWFTTVMGKMRFLGEKDIHFVWPKDSVELLVASIFDEIGTEVARARMRYRLRHEAWNTVKSLRLRM